VEGVEMKGVGRGWSRQTCQLRTSIHLINFIQVLFPRYCVADLL